MSVLEICQAVAGELQGGPIRCAKTLSESLVNVMPESYATRDANSKTGRKVSVMVMAGAPKVQLSPHRVFLSVSLSLIYDSRILYFKPINHNGTQLHRSDPPVFQP